MSIFKGFNVGVNAHGKMYASGTLVPGWLYYRKYGKAIQGAHRGGFHLGWWLLPALVAYFLLMHFAR